jgi:UPF0755 protein
MGSKPSAKNNRKRLLKGLLIVLAVIIAGACIVGYKYYRMIFNVNVKLGDKREVYFFIPTGSDYNAVRNKLVDEKILIDEASFSWLAEKKGYTTAVKPGRYLIEDGMTNNALINMLRSGRQEPVKLVLNNIRTRQQLAGKVGGLIEADSTSIMDLLENETYTKEKYGLSKEAVMVIFIPNTYEIYWNTSAEEFADRMYKEYEKFWNDERRKKAAEINLKPEEVTILASIVHQETKKLDEVPKIAGVYINRLELGMHMEACPTVIFAIGDFTKKRVLFKDLEYVSPYNTYLNPGLPPGPICLPPPEVVDKTLNYERSDYLFFSAKEDFSGYHNFARTNAQHAQNAAKYQAALNRELQKKKKQQKK